MRPSTLNKKLLYPTVFLLAITGILWLIAHYFMQIEGDFGPEKHPLEIWTLRLHGLAGVITLLWLGMLVEHHIISFFKHKRRMITGISLTFLIGWLGISGYMLYYLSEDNWRYYFSLGHWIIGIGVIILFVVHVVFKSFKY